MTLLRQVLAVFCMVLLTAPVLAGEMRYGADIHQSVWRADSRPLHCTLTQNIPYYGRAVFEKQAGGKLAFYIQVMRSPKAVGMAKLVSTAPAWKHDVMVRDLGQVDYSQSSTPFKVNEVTARRLLLELEQGMFPTFSYKDWSDGRDRIQVAISAVNVRKPLGSFLECLDNLIDFTLEDVRMSRIQFGFDSSELSANARRRLDQVAEYLLADPEVRKVTLEGLTDNVGYRRYNQQLAKRRAAAVRDYLVSKGVSSGKFTISAIGERRPAASNRTARGRANNRVVVVSLLK